MLCRSRTTKEFRWGKVVAAVVLLVVVGCHSPPPVPVDNRPPPPSEKINYHLVSQGETLFSIAWRYEKDVQKLARANGLTRPYTIYRGQRLTLDTRHIPVVVHRPKSPAKTGGASSPRPSSKVTPSTSSAKKKNSTWASNWRWQWPVQGTVSKRFNSTSLFKGIDVHSHAGAPVVAAAPGVVVYSGNGLRGYGRLIIVKHNDVYLSAYAHNRKILVKEGQSVKGGQKISEVGGDPSNTKRLYFEIRKDGKPVDPLHYLPKR